MIYYSTLWTPADSTTTAQPARHQKCPGGDWSAPQVEVPTSVPPVTVAPTSNGENLTTQAMADSDLRVFR